MDDTCSAKMRSKISKESLSRTQIYKKRKLAQKVVVTVKMEGSDKKKRNEGPPSDCWSWRKYGQKPIKGSPYPRGYYRCSTSKGCSAKKQVERCRTDPSVLIITYTASHNHAGPDLLEKQNLEFKETSTPLAEDQHHPTTTSKQEEEEEVQEQEQEPEREQKKLEDGHEDHFHYCKSPGYQDIIIINKEGNPFSEDMETTYDSLPSSLVKDKCPPYPHLMNFPAPKSEENDFYDELEELPTSSFFSSFTRRNFFEERIPINPF